MTDFPEFMKRPANRIAIIKPKLTLQRRAPCSFL
jgi:hypothetical protein